MVALSLDTVLRDAVDNWHARLLEESLCKENLAYVNLHATNSTLRFNVNTQSEDGTQ